MSPSEHRSHGDRPGRREVAGAGGRRQPAGIERARRTPGAPPRRPVPKVARAPKPEFPAGETPNLPKAVLREIRKVVSNDHVLADELALALSIGSEAIDAGEPDVALRYLAWAKDVAPRSPAIREALGVARYLAEDYPSALTELQAYRRLSGREDQNHLLADCHRALDGDTDKIAELVETMHAAGHVPDERSTEGSIVWASAVADDGDLGAARAILRRRLEQLGSGGEPAEARLRLWYVAGELAERAGDTSEARALFTRVAAAAPDAFDVETRLQRL